MKSYECKLFQKSLDLDIKAEIVIKDEPLECSDENEPCINEQLMNDSGHQVKDFFKLGPEVPKCNGKFAMKIEDNANDVDKLYKKDFIDQSCTQHSQIEITGYKYSDGGNQTSQNYAFGRKEAFFCKIQNSEFPKVILRRLDTKSIEMCDSSRFEDLKSKRYIAEISKPNTTDEIENNGVDSCKYSVGDVVWVNLRGYPLWPGMIAYSKNASPHFIKLKLGSSKKSVKPKQYHVQFFNDNHQTMWASSTSIFPYNGLRNLLISFDKLKLSLRSGKPCKTKERNLLKTLLKMSPLLTRNSTNPISLRWYGAVVEADNAMSMRPFDVIRWRKSQPIETRNSDELDLEISLDPKFDSEGEFSGFEDEGVKSETESLILPKSCDGKSSKVEVKANVKYISEVFTNDDCEVKNKLFSESIGNYEKLSKKNNGGAKPENILPEHNHSLHFPESVRSKEYTNCEMRNDISHDPSMHSIQELVCGHEKSEFAKGLNEAKEKSFQSRKSFCSTQAAYAALSSSPSGQGKRFSTGKVVSQPSKSNCKYNKKLKITSNSSTKLFKYSECDFETKDKIYIKTHLLLHSNTKPFKCSECDFETKHRNYLKFHLLNHSNTKRFNCSECGYGTNRKDLLKTHLLNHTNIKLFKCSECDYKSNYKNHIKTHNLVHLASKLFKCSECDYETNHKDQLKTHIANHSETKLFKCNECDYKTNDKKCFKSHLIIHSNINLFKCSECDFETRYKRSLKSHLLNHLNTRLFKCSECNYETNKKMELKTHLLNHSDIKLFKCFQCNYETNRKDYFKTHLLIHSEIKLLKCPECVYETNNKISFKIHLLNHSNTRLFKCSECDYETNHKGNFKNHFLIHSEAKLFKCWECDYKTNYKGSLKTHLLDHSDKKLFKCSECNYQTNYKNNFKAHLLTHTDTKLFK